jgi:membrane-bound serine protease (ClpP class)
MKSLLISRLVLSALYIFSLLLTFPVSGETHDGIPGLPESFDNPALLEPGDATDTPGAPIAADAADAVDAPSAPSAPSAPDTLKSGDTPGTPDARQPGDSLDGRQSVDTSAIGEAGDTVRVYQYTIDQNIEPSAWRLTRRAFDKARQARADYMLVNLNTYGGLVNIADSIRTRFLNSPIPVLVFIRNNAASAGALISIAADSIYMSEGARMGAASVVNQQGQVMPEKYQSYMRSTMRATAEAHGRDTIVSNGDTLSRWHRDPRIAEAMVDPRIVVDGVVDSTEILTFTTQEAIDNGYCEGRAANVREVLQRANIETYTIQTYEMTGLESFSGLLMSPALQGILIMIIVAGLYFELQSPGVGFPLVIAIIAATLYFAPLYLEGIAENWELGLFVLGVILIGVELFVIPGFGVAGIAGILLTVTGLVLSMVDNIVFDYQFQWEEAFKSVVRSFLIVSVSVFVSLVLSLYLSKKLLTSSGSFSRLVLDSTQQKDEGYIGVDSQQKQLVGKTGTAHTVLRPGGKVVVEGEIYDARSEIGFIEKGEVVRVIEYGTSQLVVVRDEPIEGS